MISAATQPKPMPIPAMHTLAPYRCAFPEAFATLDEWQRDAQARRARWTPAQTPLSIGVIGQVKAGKSSFLNQLLFGGQALLPEAATPKTANLTRIYHAASPCFTAHFYAPDDWATLTRLAASPAQDDAARSARDLVQSALAQHGDVTALLAQGEVHLHADSLTALLGQINDYVGADGRFTPLVESSTLGLPLPALEGLEIVDTPGMNDPVVSRTVKTRDYMALCDVVFFLSPAGRLLDESDQQLLAAQLPEKGVKRLVLVAAQFDSAILDDGPNRNSLADCETHLRKRLTDHARRNLERLAAQRERQGMTTVAALLRSMVQPLFASTYAQALATRPPADWSKNQQHVYQQFEELAQDFWGGQVPQTADWLRLAGFAALDDALNQARTDKAQILAQQRAELESELAASLAQHLTRLHDQACERLAFMQQHELADLEGHARQVQQRMDRIANTLSTYLRQQADAARGQARQMTADLQQQSQRARTLEARTGTKNEVHTKEVSDSVWYKPWTWGSSHFESYTVTRHYTYLATADALDNLHSYLEGARRDLLARFDRLISPSSLSAGLRSELLKVLDTRSEGFDPRGLRALVETTLEHQPWPRLDVSVPDPARALEGLADELRDERDMAELRRRLAHTVGQLQQLLAQRLNDAVQQACKQLEALAGTLHQALSQSLAADLERLHTSLTDKTRQVAHLQDLVREVKPLMADLKPSAHGLSA